jgi:uncharacterized protein YjbI with pentapeptide repeats
MEAGLGRFTDWEGEFPKSFSRDKFSRMNCSGINFPDIFFERPSLTSSNWHRVNFKDTFIVNQPLRTIGFSMYSLMYACTIQLFYDSLPVQHYGTIHATGSTQQ